MKDHSNHENLSENPIFEERLEQATSTETSYAVIAQIMQKLSQTQRS